MQEVPKPYLSRSQLYQERTFGFVQSLVQAEHFFTRGLGHGLRRASWCSFPPVFPPCSQRPPDIPFGFLGGVLATSWAYPFFGPSSPYRPGMAHVCGIEKGIKGELYSRLILTLAHDRIEHEEFRPPTFTVHRF